MILYLIIGLAISLFYDMVHYYLVKNEELRFNNWERLATVFFWPIIMGFSIYQMLKKNKDEH